jgi:hypothetical protein
MKSGASVEPFAGRGRTGCAIERSGAGFGSARATSAAFLRAAWRSRSVRSALSDIRIMAAA